MCRNSVGFGQLLIGKKPDETNEKTDLLHVASELYYRYQGAVQKVFQ